ncbi:DUF1269 domain-containing protein [Pseudanabaena sp. PCC 6802]|uniref:DUF1269 domain-containing protein n=1 Tax=Pseudanabaena sp. PCC 6802 TaxID=118173 RepID=UPI000347FB1A|nr:DUF1269 domain-containing protein [Pseudanabaena sp. PCC 6802]
MATLTVLKFPTSDGAEKAAAKLLNLQQQQLIKVEDMAVVSWESGKKKPRTRQAVPTTQLGALDGAFWGLLFGLIFFMPLLGAAIGALTGALAGSMTDFGIDDDFIKKVREQVTEGTSALFALTSDAVVDRVVDAFKDEKFEIVATNLPSEQESKLREIFEHPSV